MHDLGKALTPSDELPRHIGHEHRGVRRVRALCRATEGADRTRRTGRAGLPRAPERASRVRTEAGDAAETAGRAGCAAPSSAAGHLSAACEADKRGRLGHEHDAYPQANYLREARAAAAAVDAARFVAQGLAGPAIGKAMEPARIAAIATLKTKHPPSRSAV